jgi:hypothetical protein
MRKFKDLESAPSSDTQEKRVCAGQALGFPLRSALGFSPIETVTLDVFRCVCDVYSTASAEPWEGAVRLAEQQLGAIDGPLLVARVTALLRALRQERGTGFSYLSLGCQHVSPDELTVTALIKSARVGDQLAFQHGIALALNNAPATEQTRLAVRCLADMQLQQASAEQEAGSEFEHQTVQALYLH